MRHVIPNLHVAGMFQSMNDDDREFGVIELKSVGSFYENLYPRIGISDARHCEFDASIVTSYEFPFYEIFAAVQVHFYLYLPAMN